MGDLRTNFSKKEFKCKCGCGVYKEMDPSLLDGLQLLSDQTKRKITINSGYRCPNHKIEAKKKKPGEHSRARAADLVIEGYNKIQTLAAVLQIPQFKNGGVGIYPDKDLIHVDTRPNRARWSYINNVQRSYEDGIDLIQKNNN
jgi:zinc D-Ala-D-Ala carboxypeptidase